MKQTLWTRNFSLLIFASALGIMGSIAGSFALSFLVFDETGSTLAAALIVAIQFIPSVFLPFLVAPWMDRLPRKLILVLGDLCAGVIYGCMGLYLIKCSFSYAGYLMVSLLLSCVGAVDELAFNSIYPSLIPQGMEEQGFAVSSMLYPVLKVIFMPLAGILLDTVGVAMILIFQGVCSILAALIENGIQAVYLSPTEPYSLKGWLRDIREAASYLKEERGLRSIYCYSATSCGVANGYSPILVAFFRTAPGFSAALYSLFSVAEFLGRAVGSMVQYRVRIPDKKKFPFAFGVYQFYDMMDMSLLWVPYPLMLVNRCLCGFLGSNSAILRTAAVQRHIPENLRARINAFEGMLTTASCALFSVLVGALGEILDYRLCVTICGLFSMVVCWIFIWGRRSIIRPIYEGTSQG